MTKRILIAVFLTSFFIACQSVHQTGRSQFMVVSQERQLGDQAYRDILNKSLLSNRS